MDGGVCLPISARWSFSEKNGGGEVRESPERGNNARPGSSKETRGRRRSLFPHLKECDRSRFLGRLRCRLRSPPLRVHAVYICLLSARVSLPSLQSAVAKIAEKEGRKRNNIRNIGVKLCLKSVPRLRRHHDLFVPLQSSGASDAISMRHHDGFPLRV